MLSLEERALVESKLCQYGELLPPLELPRGEVKTLPQGTRMTLENSGLVFVLSGVMREAFIAPDGRDHTRLFLNAGCVTGSAFARMPVPATLVAMKPTRIWVVDARTVKSLVETNRMWQEIVHAIVSRAHEAAIEREFRFTTMSPLEHYQFIRRTLPWLHNDVPLYEVASFLRITPEHLSRIRRNLITRSAMPRFETREAGTVAAAPASTG